MDWCSASVLLIAFFVFQFTSKSTAHTVRWYRDTPIGNHEHNHRHPDFRRSPPPNEDNNNYEQQNVALENGDVNVKDSHYPYEEIRNFLQNNKLLKDYFIGQQAIPQIGNRDGLPEEQGENLCRVREYKVIYPQKLRNINNIERTIVNIQNEYEQAIQVRTCHSEGQCSKLESVAFGYTSYCDQEFVTRELMIFNGSRAFDQFKFPSCCVCKIKRV